MKRATDPLREALAELAEAVTDTLGTMAYYFGPNARTAVSGRSVDAFRRIEAARDAALEALEDVPAEPEQGVTQRSAPQPPPTLTLHWCDTCGVFSAIRSVIADGHGPNEDCPGNVLALAYHRPVEHERESLVEALLDESPNYGSEHCDCGSVATPARDCPVHWALWVAERPRPAEPEAWEWRGHAPEWGRASDAGTLEEARKWAQPVPVAHLERRRPGTAPGEWERVDPELREDAL